MVANSKFRNRKGGRPGLEGSVGRFRFCPLAKSHPIRDKRAMRKGHRPSKPPSNRPRFWGKHAVYAALDNPNRVSRKLWATREAASAIVIPDGLTVAFSDLADVGRMVPND